LNQEEHRRKIEIVNVNNPTKLGNLKLFCKNKRVCGISNAVLVVSYCFIILTTLLHYIIVYFFV
jgi:hypothetical protein